MTFLRCLPVVLTAGFLFLTIKPVTAQVVLNEYSCANLDQFPDNYAKHEDWIELYNKDSVAVDLGGYFLSDNKDKPTKWPIPAGTMIGPRGYLVFWASGRDASGGGHYHTNFKLTQTKNNPETITFAKPNGIVLDLVKINKTKALQSRGRITDGGATWGVLTAPSPKKTNNTSPHFAGYADRPDFSVEAGFYTDSVVVTLANNEPGATLYYTTDGKDPVASSKVYTDPIVLKATAVLKALAVSPDTTLLPGFVEYGTYFINEPHTLPVVSIAGADLRNLANGSKNLRPWGSAEYFDAQGKRKTRTYGEFNSHGQDSWVNDQRSLDLVARDEMGYNDALKQKIFEYSDRDEFQRIILRAAGDDNYPGNFLPSHEGCAHLRDAYVHNLAKRGGLNLDVRLSEKAILYIDGKYWGVYDLREIPDDHDYTDFYYGQGKYDIQYILTWGNTWAEYGGSKALSDWKALYNYIQTHSMANPEYYAYVTSQLDVTSLVDYVLVNSFTVCSDWLNYNTGWWRGLNPDGSHQKWGYILWDNDATFGYYINYTNIPDTSATALPCNPEFLGLGSDPEGHIRLLKRLMVNPDFKQYYVSRYIDLQNTVFNCDNMLPYLDTIAGRIAPEMTQHAARWGGSYDDWQKNVERLRDFITRRCEAMPAGLIECYSLTGPYDLTFDLDPDSLGLAQMQINSLTIDQFPYTGTYFGGIDLKLNLIPDSTKGYTFDHWSAGGQVFLPGDSVLQVTLDLSGPDTLIAHFVQQSTAVPDPERPMPVLEVAPTLVHQTTTLTFDLPEPAEVSVQLFSASGRRVEVLTDGSRRFTAGRYSLQLDLGRSGLPAGVYVLHFTAGGRQQSIKIVYAP